MSTDYYDDDSAEIKARIKKQLQLDHLKGSPMQQLLAVLAMLDARGSDDVAAIYTETSGELWNTNNAATVASANTTLKAMSRDGLSFSTGTSASDVTVDRDTCAYHVRDVLLARVSKIVWNFPSKSVDDEPALSIIEKERITGIIRDVRQENGKQSQQAGQQSWYEHLPEITMPVVKIRFADVVRSVLFVTLTAISLGNIHAAAGISNLVRGLDCFATKDELAQRRRGYEVGSQRKILEEKPTTMWGTLQYIVVKPNKAKPDISVVDNLVRHGTFKAAAFGPRTSAAVQSQIQNNETVMVKHLSKGAAAA